MKTPKEAYAAVWEAAESIRPFLEAVFALHGGRRRRPFPRPVMENTSHGTTSISL